MLRLIAIVILLGFPQLSYAQKKLHLNLIKLPPGFVIEVFAKAPGARSLTQAPDGRIFVGNRSGKTVSMIAQGKSQISAGARSVLITKAPSWNSEPMWQF